MPDKIKTNGISLYGKYMSNSSISDEIKHHRANFGQKMAEKIAKIVGSWTFIIIQSIFLIAWISFSVYFVSISWDPFMLMNLFLSLQAAYTAPLILMSQNRQAAQDRNVLYEGWNIDRKTNRIINDMEIDIDNKLYNQNEKLDSIINMLNKKKEEDEQ